MIFFFAKENILLILNQPEIFRLEPVKVYPDRVRKS